MLKLAIIRQHDEDGTLEILLDADLEALLADAAYKRRFGKNKAKLAVELLKEAEIMLKQQTVALP